MQINSVPYYAHPNSNTMTNVGQVSPALPLPIKQIELIADNHFKRYIDELNSRVYEVMGDQVIDKLKQSNIDVNCPSQQFNEGIAELEQMEDFYSLPVEFGESF